MLAEWLQPEFSLGERGSRAWDSVPPRIAEGLNSRGQLPLQ